MSLALYVGLCTGAVVLVLAVVLILLHGERGRER